MYERFTDRARKVMQRANQEAIRLKHQYIGSEHILLGLVREGSGVAVQVLTNLSVDPQKVVMEIERRIEKGASTNVVGESPRLPPLKNVIEYAMEEARNLKHGYVGTEHILLGLLREDAGVAGVALATLGLRVEEVRKEVESVLRQPHDWGRKPSLPQFPATWAWAAQASKFLPNACPKCGHAPVVRVIWGWIGLLGINFEDIATGRAILGSSSGEKGPPWVCLQCAPKWSEVHRLAMQDYELQVEKEKQIVATDFESAARCRDKQEELRRQLAMLFEELAREQ